jgi:hypothetical protein
MVKDDAQRCRGYSQGQQTWDKNMGQDSTGCITILGSQSLRKEIPRCYSDEHLTLTKGRYLPALLPCVKRKCFVASLEDFRPSLGFDQNALLQSASANKKRTNKMTRGKRKAEGTQRETMQIRLIADTQTQRRKHRTADHPSAEPMPKR